MTINKFKFMKLFTRSLDEVVSLIHRHSTAIYTILANGITCAFVTCFAFMDGRSRSFYLTGIGRLASCLG
ncbi:hypothetical protein AXFE_21980 [Acidithrix ferrooxidans]|uniref:Uncharacterized protein n=1 Tax=Acidithrix ferrooxidans TaxID=1280514 RepID=A0A0D8HG35_9ACTN|nr:hypothetical protein AXFE_21980 [Acidithrix ferrooxidans]